MVRDRLLQRPISHRVTAKKILSRHATKNTRGDLRPKFHWESVQARKVGSECARCALVVVRKKSEPTGIAREMTLPGWPPFACSRIAAYIQPILWKRFADTGARTNDPLEVAFGDELFKAGDDRAPRKVIGFGQFSGRREPRARAKLAIQNLLADCGIKPAIGRRFNGRVRKGNRKG